VTTSPKNAIELAMEMKTASSTFRAYSNKYQKYSLYLALGFLILGMLLGGLTYFFKSNNLYLFAAICLLITAIATLVYQLTIIAPEVMKLKNFEREISASLIKQFDSDLKLIEYLSITFEIHHLKHAQENFVLMAKHLRERISLLVGSVDKVGVVPLAITGYFSLTKAPIKELEIFGGVEWLYVAFACLYLGALKFSATAQWMESLAKIYERSIELRSKREN
jgi:hypothetical protein